MSDTAQLELLLREILLELRALPGEIARAVAAADRNAGIALKAEDRQAIAVLLPEITRVIGWEILFSMQNLLEHSRDDSSLLAVVEKVAGAKTLDGKACQRVGMLLSRASGFVHDGAMLDRAVKLREGVLWQVRKVTLECHEASPASPRL